jgi:hypothetical protein
MIDDTLSQMKKNGSMRDIKIRIHTLNDLHEKNIDIMMVKFLTSTPAS